MERLFIYQLFINQYMNKYLSLLLTFQVNLKFALLREDIKYKLH